MRVLITAFSLLIGAALAQKPTVVVTVEPYRFLLQELVGDRMLVRVLVPPSFNPHVYEPTPSQVKEVAQAALVVANGAGLDKWVVDKLVRPNNLNVPVFQATEVVAASLIPTPTGPDPHIWVDPALMAKVVPPLAEALAKVDPAGKALYQARAQRLERALRDLDREVADRLRVRSKPGVIALRNPFRYFSQRYQIPILYVVVPNPEAPDVTAKAVAEAKRLAQEKGVRHLLAPLPTKAQAEALARNMGLEVVLVDGLGEGATSYRDLILSVAQAFAQALR